MNRQFGFKETRRLLRQYNFLFNQISACFVYRDSFENKIRNKYSFLKGGKYFEKNITKYFEGDEQDLSSFQELIELIGRYSLILDITKEQKKKYDEIQAKISAYRKNINCAKNSIKWFFTSRENKEKAVDAYINLSDFLHLNLYVDTQNLVENCLSIKNLDSSLFIHENANENAKFFEIYKNVCGNQFTKELISPVKKLVKKYNENFEYELRIKEFTKEAKMNIEEAVDSLLSFELIQLLKKIPAEEITREKKGLRIKPLLDSGIKSMADVYQKSEYDLCSIRGISDDIAYYIKKISDRYAMGAKKSLKLKLSIDDKNRYSSALIKELYFYKKFKETAVEWFDFCKNSLRKIKTAFKNLIDLQDGSLWFCNTPEYQENARENYGYLSSSVFGEFENKALNALEIIDDFGAVKEEEAWNDFAKDNIQYFNLLEEIIPGVLGNDDSIYGLPKDLAGKLENQKILTDGLKCTLRKYQEWGVKFILHQERVLLGDEMGLGKTVQAIASMVSLKNSGATHFIVVCPASVLTNWCREILKHSNLKVYKIHGKWKYYWINSWQKYGGVAVTTYETTGAFKRKNLIVDQVIVDEAHYIKNRTAARSIKTRELCSRSKRILFMTGTALENRVDEMIELVSVLNHDVAKTVSRFAFMSSAPEFREKIAPVYYRRKRSDVLTELPDLIESKEWCTLTPEEEKIYENSVLSKDFAGARRVSWNLSDLTSSTKAKRLLEIIEEAKADGRKVLIFSFFLDTISKIKNLLGDKCLTPITGALSPEKRQEIIDKFDSACPGSALVLQIQSGGTGLNIQSASVVVLCEPQFKPSIENQAISRAYRMGQARNVQVFRLLAENTVDEKLIQVLEEKQNIFNAFADKSVAGEKSLDIDEQTFKSIIEQEIERLSKKPSENTDILPNEPFNEIEENTEYYEELLKLSYKQICNKLLDKYGPVKGDYFVNTECKTKNKTISRSNEGLFIHHIDEDQAIMLSESRFAVQKPFMYQKADRLVYCNILEHYLLHVKITEESVVTNETVELVGIGGALILIGRQLNDIYSGKQFTRDYMIKASELISNEFESYIKILNFFWNVIKNNPYYSKQITKNDLAMGWEGNLIEQILNKIK